jgi:hypothetical protein
MTAAAALMVAMAAPSRYGSAPEQWRAVMSEEDQDIELSEHSCEISQDGITVQVGIYRLKDSNDGWTLEVVDEDDNSLIWEDTFATEIDAWNEFQRALDDEGIAQLIGPPDGSVH